MTASFLKIDDPGFLGILLDQLPVGLVAVDASGQVRLFNAAATLQWGVTSSAQVPALEALRWSTPEGEALEASATPLARALRGEHLQDERYLLRREDGGRVQVRCTARPLQAEEGIRGAVLLTQVLSEAAAAPAALPRPLSERERYQQDRDEFLATVSHELRTPLNAVLGWASVLRSRKVEPGVMEKALASIERNARIQVRLVDDLLDLGRMVSGKLRVGLRPLEVRGFILAAVDTTRSAAEARGVALEAELEASSGLTVLGDAERLQQVVWNLLTNAVKFTPRGGRVLVRAFPEAGQLVVEVRDTGMGIPPDFMPHLFERFRQADNKPVQGYRGLGLGLALVRHLVELHGGTVAAQSEGLEKGSTFRVLLPLAQPAA